MFFSLFYFLFLKNMVIEMDNFVEELRQETRWPSTEETEDESVTNALVPGIYLPLLPKHLKHPSKFLLDGK